MSVILDTTEVEDLASLVEEATRSTKEGVKRFIEPAQGTLRRAVSKRHHIIFGRRGSGKSSLLRKAAADLTVDRRPIAYVDLETFKGHSYPDVLLSVLIKTFEGFEEWLKTAAINPANKTSFWQKLFGTQPTRKAFNRKRANELAEILHQQITELKKLLYSADEVATSKITKLGEETTDQDEVGLKIPLKLELTGKITDTRRLSQNEELQEAFSRSKSQFLHQHILEYQQIFRDIALLSDGDSYLFLDDLYHIRRVDQANVIDYFHRIAKGNNLWLKIGTIRYRTQWYVNGDPPIGLKIGDDADDIDLDLTLEKYSLAKQFLNKILQGFLSDCNLSMDYLVTDGVVDRLVLASGGVARDFLGIFRRSISFAKERLTISSEHHRGQKIGVEDVNNAAGEYDSAKREELIRDTLDDKSKLEEEFVNIIEFCRTRKSNCFLVEKDLVKDTQIDELVDLRLIHKVSSRETVSRRPGKVFEAYMLDLSQYTAARKVRDLQMIEFWKPDSKDVLRRVGLIYAPNNRLSGTEEASVIPPEVSENSSEEPFSQGDDQEQLNLLE